MAIVVDVNGIARLTADVVAHFVIGIDDRGFFKEIYREDAFRDGGINAVFVQDNVTRSVQGVLRNSDGTLQAITWEALRKCGIGDRVEGYGKLLREY